MEPHPTYPESYGITKVYVRWYRDNHVSPQQTEVAIELLQQFLGTLLMMNATIMEVR